MTVNVNRLNYTRTNSLTQAYVLSTENPSTTQQFRKSKKNEVNIKK